MIRSEPKSIDANDKLAPDLTPLLDIIFIVMVFLLLTANIQIQSLKIDVPQTSDAEVLQPASTEMVVINLLATEPKWAIQGEAITTWESFTERLLSTIAANNKNPVVIAADKNARVEDMLALLAFLQKNQIQTTNLVMDEK